MTNAEIPSTSTGRRWFAALVGAIAFVVCIFLFSAVIRAILGAAQGADAAHGIAWAIGGFVCAWVSMICAGLIAPDLERKIFFYNSMVVIGIVALIIFGGNGFGLVGAISAIPFVFGAYFGTKTAVKP